MAVTTITTAGDGSWTCPADVFAIWVELWGAGGGGGGNIAAAGGGSGGCYRRQFFFVTPGAAYAYHVGYGGNGGSVGHYGGNDGEASYWVDANTLSAQGGQAGLSSAGSTTPMWAGQDAGYGTWWNGGSGGSGAPGGPTGGGGGSAGSLSNGTNGVNNAGVDAVYDGGAGGAPVTNGGAPGGGGGGSGVGDSGGDGAPGQIRISTYTVNFGLTRKLIFPCFSGMTRGVQ